LLIAVDYEPLPAVVAMTAAIAPDAQLWREAPGNVAFTWEAGDRAATEAAFAAHRVVEAEIVNSRIMMAALGTRGALVQFDAATERYTVYTASQMPHASASNSRLRWAFRRRRSASPSAMSAAASALRNPLYPEYIAHAWAAGRIGCPVRWIAARSEAFLADYHGRDNISRAALALDEDGRFLGLRVSTLAGSAVALAPKGSLSPTSNIPALSRPGEAEQMRSSAVGLLIVLAACKDITIGPPTWPTCPPTCRSGK
jgi:carbon-monoxide dehydrogenase large subunit